MEVVWLGGCGRAGRLRGCCCGYCCALVVLGDVCCGRGCGGEDERCRCCTRGQWTTREGCRFPWTHVAAERRLGCLRMRPPVGKRVRGDCHPQTTPWGGCKGCRLRGRDCADSCGGRRKPKKLLSFGFPIRRTLPQHFVCSLSCSRFCQKIICWDTTGYLIRLSNPPARCDPFTEPRNTMEQIKVCSERLTIVFVGSLSLARMWKLRSAAPIIPACNLV